MSATASIDREIAKQSTHHSSSSSSASSCNSSSNFVQLDELSQFGARKQNRLPVLIRLPQDEIELQQPIQNSMPTMSAEQLETQGDAATKRSFNSLPATTTSVGAQRQQPQSPDVSGDFQLIEVPQSMDTENVLPSLPAPQNKQNVVNSDTAVNTIPKELNDEAAIKKALADAQSLVNYGGLQQASFVGDSLIEMVINLRAENQNLVRALEINNQYVKDRIDEFKRAQEESERREAAYAKIKADLEHQVRKLSRQNSVLSDRLKLMESKLKDMRVEVNDTLDAARSSALSSSAQQQQQPTSGQNDGTTGLYPRLEDPDSILRNLCGLSEEQQKTPGQNEEDDRCSSNTASSDDNADNESNDSDNDNDDEANRQTLQMPSEPQHVVGAICGDSRQLHQRQAKAAAKDRGKQNNPSAPPMETEDSPESAFDPLAQCDKLERQLGELGRRDYEICLLQQQLNIYRQDFRLERMAKLEAKLQIEKLKSDIERLCLDRVRERTRSEAEAAAAAAFTTNTNRDRFASAGLIAADAVGKIGHQLQKKAIRTAARAAKYASKQAHLEEKIAARMAAAATGAAGSGLTTGGSGAATSTDAKSAQPPQSDSNYTGGRRHSRRHHYHHGGGSHGRGVGSEIVGDLLSTANKAMLTGYKLTSTHVNIALDKLSQFEQVQANKLVDNKNRNEYSTNSALVANQNQKQKQAN